MHVLHALLPGVLFVVHAAVLVHSLATPTSPTSPTVAPVWFNLFAAVSFVGFFHFVGKAAEVKPGLNALNVFLPHRHWPGLPAGLAYGLLLLAVILQAWVLLGLEFDILARLSSMWMVFLSCPAVLGVCHLLGKKTLS
jgi:hypothetical protein